MSAHTVDMPDRDVFPGLHRSWRRVARAACGRQPPEVVSSLGEKALADQLRRDHVGTAKAAEAATAIAHAGSGAIRGVIDDADLQESAVLRCLKAVGAASGGDELELIDQALTRMMRAQLESVRPRLVAEGSSRADADTYLEECMAGIRTGPLADQVATGRQRIRAPRRARGTTAELLHEPLT